MGNTEKRAIDTPKYAATCRGTLIVMKMTITFETIR
jgi:hypothetical protein